MAIIKIFQGSSTGLFKRKTLLLIVLVLLLMVWFFLYKSLLKTAVAKTPKIGKTTNSTEDTIYELVDYNSHFAKMKFDDANDARNETGYENDIVPDIVHYIQLENPYLDFVTLISILSTIRHHQPKFILLHTDRKEGFMGKYWDHLQKVVKEDFPKTIIRVNKIRRPKYIFGKKLSSVYHASDIARTAVLRTFGGIYLDNDVYVVKSLHSFRKYEFSLGWPEGQFLGTQVLVGHRNARFLKLYHQSYQEYKPTKWYYNAGELPTTSILIAQPHLVHRVKLAFGVHYLLPMLYRERYPFWQKDFYTVHLLQRHRPHGDGIVYFNEDNIRDYNCTFGEMARLAYYGTKELMD